MTSCYTWRDPKAASSSLALDSPVHRNDESEIFLVLDKDVIVMLKTPNFAKFGARGYILQALPSSCCCTTTTALSNEVPYVEMIL